MKRLCNGKLYDTIRSTCLASYSSGHLTSNPNSVYENLYVDRGNNLFLQIEGGSLSKYGIQAGEQMIGSTRLKAIDRTEALVWLEFRNIEITTEIEKSVIETLVIEKGVDI